MKTIVEEINELRSMAVSDLVTRYEEVFAKPPRIKNRDHLWRRIAWKIQEQRFGGLPGPARRTLNALMGEIELPDQMIRKAGTAHAAPQRPGRPAIGTTLVRAWHDREYRVRVMENGFELDGVVHKSLSAVAKAITGQAWNGSLFFHLKKRGKK